MDPAPSPKPAHYAYAVVNVTKTPPEILDIKLTRQLAKEVIRWRPDADQLRVRRARVTLFTS